MNGQVRAGHGNVGQVRGALESVEIGDEDFAAPDFAVCAVAGAVERYADHSLGKVIFRHATGDVSVVMLNSDSAEICLLFGPLRG